MKGGMCEDVNFPKQNKEDVNFIYAKWNFTIMSKSIIDWNASIYKTTFVIMNKLYLKYTKYLKLYGAIFILAKHMVKYGW